MYLYRICIIFVLYLLKVRKDWGLVIVVAGKRLDGVDCQQELPSAPVLNGPGCTALHHVVKHKDEGDDNEVHDDDKKYDDNEDDGQEDEDEDDEDGDL